MRVVKEISADEIFNILETVLDPEVPVLSIMDLGIVRSIEFVNSKPIITITPTYSGCPAMTVIEVEMRTALLTAGIQDFEIKTILSPPWTTDWMSQEGLKKLMEYGIAPPEKSSGSKLSLFGKEPEVICPQCGSHHTEIVSRFGSTACKAMYRCLDCKEPFDYFKCI
ncbi:MAG: 1,2-phenylacetyl-CoA epoxidase subunit PaaD [Bacteroidia bacterium]